MKHYLGWTRLSILLLLLAVGACSHSQNRKSSGTRTEGMTREDYIEINRQRVNQEQDFIVHYLDTTGMDMQRTATGLWYRITEEGRGDYIAAGKVVSLNYEIRLLDGTLCYSSDEDGMKVFLVGQGGVESGLEEGVLLLKQGSKATFLMPPHLAHGLVGDDDRIPARAILKYKVEVVEVKNKN